MFEFLFSKKTVKRNDNLRKSEFNLDHVCEFRPLKWEEHCIECAPPTCYRQCSHYLRRKDGSCIRLTDGLQRDKNYQGRYNFGIRCRFRIWSKLEALVIPSTVSPTVDKLLAGIDHSVIFLLLFLSKILHDYRYLAWGSCYWSKFLLRFDCLGRRKEPDFFWVEGLLLDQQERIFRLQVFSEAKVLYTSSLTFRPGHNIFSIPYTVLGIGTEKNVRIYLAPDVPEGGEVNIIFLWLDFVRLKNKKNSATKIKCVVWDLDQTVYGGILSESDEKDLQRRPKMEEIIKTLDQRGILNTICSKNDLEPVQKMLTDWGLWQYFVSPVVNWGQKSENIRQIAQHLNLGLDSFAFIDDNPHERLEVAQRLPMVRVYSENSAELLLSFPEFSTLGSGMGEQRRLSYQAEEKRIAYKENFTDQYDEYLCGLQMKLHVSSLQVDSVKKRCFELLARSNQLNLTTHRYSEEEYDALLQDPEVMALSFACSDIFGDYGIVGFASVKRIANQDPLLTDLVISCRVARKKVEEAIVCTIGEKLGKEGFSFLTAQLIKTKKNGPLTEVFSKLPFEIIEENDSSCLYRTELSKLQKHPLVLQVKEDY